MIKSIKNYIAFFVAKKKYLNKKSSPKNFKSLISNSSKILIVLPNNAEDILKALDIPAYFKKYNKEVTLITDEKFLHVAQEEFKFNTITYNEDSISKFGLPNRSLVEKISSLNIDVSLDLNREGNLFLGILANIPKPGLVAGFKKIKADNLYDLQIANHQNNAEISYRNFLNSIQML